MNDRGREFVDQTLDLIENFADLMKAGLRLADEELRKMDEREMDEGKSDDG